MPHSCAAYGCTSRRTAENRRRGITFHRFPKDAALRKAWCAAVRWKDFKPAVATFLCSCHFKAVDFDRTGQTVRLKESVIPSVFPAFPDHLKKVPSKGRLTRTSTQAGEKSEDPPAVSVGSDGSPEPKLSSTSDHHQYALDPDQVKNKLAVAEARVAELQKQLRNAKDRERRHRRTVKLLLDELKDKNMLSEDLQRELDHYSEHLPPSDGPSQDSSEEYWQCNSPG